jgi:hypothetical protein
VASERPRACTIKIAPSARCIATETTSGIANADVLDLLKDTLYRVMTELQSGADRL